MNFVEIKSVNRLTMSKAEVVEALGGKTPLADCSEQVVRDFADWMRQRILENVGKTLVAPPSPDPRVGERWEVEFPWMGPVVVVEIQPPGQETWVKVCARNGAEHVLDLRHLRRRVDK
jgi:hypothetical protein